MAEAKGREKKRSKEGEKKNGNGPESGTSF